MYTIRNKRYFIFFMLFLFFFGDAHNLGNAQEIHLSVEDDGRIHADISITSTSISSHLVEVAGQKYGMFMLVIPFEYKPNWELFSPKDIDISPVAHNKGYTIYSVIAPKTVSDLSFRIEEIGQLTETREGKAKVEFELTYRLATQSQTDLIGAPFTIKNWSLFIQLPGQYDQYEVNKSTGLLKKISPKQYKVSDTDISASTLSNIWIVFPNPLTRGLDFAKLVVSIVIGFLTTLFQAPIVRDRRPVLGFIILFISLAAVGLSIYYAVGLAKGFEFAVWAAILIPHAVVALFASVYVLVASRFQATVAGSVTLDGVAVELADITLMGGTGGSFKPVAKIDRLRNGQYSFRVWLRKGIETFLVRAQTGGASSISSQQFTLAKGQGKQIEPLGLTTTLVPAPGEQGTG